MTKFFVFSNNEKSWFKVGVLRNTIILECLMIRAGEKKKERWKDGKKMKMKLNSCIRRKLCCLLYPPIDLNDSSEDILYPKMQEK